MNNFDITLLTVIKIILTLLTVKIIFDNPAIIKVLVTILDFNITFNSVH